jgi:hypothetical protein
LKRFLLLIPLSFIFFLSGCLGAIDESTIHYVEQTQTASALPLKLASTPSPFEQLFVSTINSYLQQHEDPFSRTFDATYVVVDAQIILNDNNIPTVFSVTIKCECSRDGACCNAEHTFVVLAQAMRENVTVFLGNQIANIYIPQTVTEFRVLCYDHTDKNKSLSVSWNTMFAYMIGIDDGSELGWAVQLYETPKP